MAEGPNTPRWRPTRRASLAALAVVLVVLPLATGDDPAGAAPTPSATVQVAPTNLATDLAVDRLRSDVFVTWTPPTDLGDQPIDHVQVELWTRQPGDADTWSSRRALSVTPGSRVARFDDVAPGPTYHPVVWYVDDEGNGVGTPLPHDGSDGVRIAVPHDATPFSSLDALVAQHLQDVLGRPATATELDAGRTAIEASGDAPAWLAEQPLLPTWSTPRAPAIRLYQAYFGRLPDTSGLDYWARRRIAGVTLTTISSRFAASSEFRNTYGSLGDGAFVDLVYANVLHRSPDPAGRAHWVRRLASGASRGSVMVQFSESNEHVAALAPTVHVVLTTTTMLRRVPTGAEVAHGVEVGPRALADELRNGYEYAFRVPAEACQTERSLVVDAVRIYATLFRVLPTSVAELIFSPVDLLHVTPTFWTLAPNGQVVPTHIRCPPAP